MYLKRQSYRHTEEKRKREQEGERERGREIFDLLVHATNGCNDKSWDSPKSGTMSFFQVSWPKHLSHSPLFPQAQ